MTTRFSLGTSGSKDPIFRLARTLCTLSVAFVAACGSPPPPANVHAVHAQDVTNPGIVEARGTDETLLLQKVVDLPSQKATKVGSLLVEATAPYRSASGRNCRNLSIRRPDGSEEVRLACTEHLPGRDRDKAEGQEPWVFVPSVFVIRKDDPIAVAVPVNAETATSAEPAASTANASSVPDSGGTVAQQRPTTEAKGAAAEKDQADR